MRPGSEVNPGALLTKKLGPVDPDTTDGPPPPDCCDIDPDNVPDRVDRENGGAAVRLSTPGVLALVQFETNEESVAGSITTTLPAPATPGNLLEARMVERSGGTLATPSGWTRIGEAVKTGFGNSVMTAWYKIAAPGDQALTVTKTSGATFANLTVMEFAGAGTLVDFAVVNTSADSSSVNVGPVDVDDPDSLAVLSATQIGVPVNHTAAGYDLIATGSSNGTDPTWSVFWGEVDPPTATATVDSENGSPWSASWSALLASYSVATEAAWVVPVPNAIDGNDATFTDIDGADTAGEFLRLDLGAAYRIQRLRYVLGMTNAGSATITLDGWNETDQSDRVTVRSTTFTGTGSLTAQTVTDEWYTADSFRYWQIDGPAEVIRWFTVSLFEGTVQIAHEHPISVITTDETDTDLVLHPDGSGGVEWGPGGTVDPDTIKDAGRWELAVIPGSPPDSLYADGDWLYIWVPGP